MTLKFITTDALTPDGLLYFTFMGHMQMSLLSSCISFSLSSTHLHLSLPLLSDANFHHLSLLLMCWLWLLTSERSSFCVCMHTD